MTRTSVKVMRSTLIDQSGASTKLLKEVLLHLFSVLLQSCNWGYFDLQRRQAEIFLRCKRVLV